MTAPVPYDAATEAAVIGAMFARPRNIGDIASVACSSDFYQPNMGRIFGLLVDGWRTGEPFDQVSFCTAYPDLLTRQDAARLELDAPYGHSRVVERLVDLRVRRDLIGVMTEMATAARDLSLDPVTTRDMALEAVAALQTPLAEIRDLWEVEAFFDQPDEQTPWVIPGMFKQGWRVVVVATEGRGKTVLSKQIAVAASCGIHPLMTSDPIPPVPTLIVDLENPTDAIVETGRAMRRAAGAAWGSAMCSIWHRPGGINVRRPRDRAELEAVIAKTRPALVTIGPLYKLYATSARETDEQAAGEVQTILDDLRTRYGFALLLEHHAPKSSGPQREIQPFGSSLWLRWPEMGLKLTPYKDPSTGDVSKTKLSIGKWREHRVSNRWPDRIDRSAIWPWVGEWDRPYRSQHEEMF